MKGCCHLVVILVTVCSCILSSQEVTTDPFAAKQIELSNKITLEWDEIWNSCNALVRKPIDNETDVKRYLECFFGDLPNYFRLWVEEIKNALPGGKEIIDQYFIQNMPTGETAAADRQIIIGIAVHAHQRLTAWHQRIADLANALGATNFFIKTEIETVLGEVQKSYVSCSTIAREFVNDLKQEKTLSKEGLQKMCDDFTKAIFEPPVAVIDKQLVNMLNATSRAERQYPTFLQQSGTDYREFVKAYDEFFTKIFETLNTCASNLWTPKQQQKEQSN